MSIADGVDPKADDLLRYWFGEAWSTNRKFYIDQDKYHKVWFGGGPAVDEEIKQRFGQTHAAMAAGSLDKWLENPASAIAGIILIDQLSRNMYRGSAQTYALDAKGLAWAKHILDTKMCDDFPAPMRFFLSMVLEHSEALEDQNRSVAFNRALLAEAEAATEAGDPDGPAAIKIFQQTLAYAIAHQEVVEKWGRFPHRNAILGRESTPEEVAGLANKTIRSF